MIMGKWNDKSEFKARVMEFAGKMDIEVRALAIRPMTNKWASCSTDGNLISIKNCWIWIKKLAIM